MKKIMMTLAAAVLAISASAQVYVGGTLGFKSENVNHDLGNGASTDQKETTFKIRPEVGYNLNENWAVGAQIGFTSITHNNNGPTTTMFDIAPYARYTFLKLGSVSIFADGKINFGTSTTETDLGNGVKQKAESSDFGINIVPGVAFKASEKISFVAKLGDGLGYNYHKIKDGDKTTTFGLDLNSLASLNFGLYYNF